MNRSNEESLACTVACNELLVQALTRKLFTHLQIDITSHHKKQHLKKIITKQLFGK